MSAAELEQARKDQMRRYNRLRAAAYDCRERAIKASYEPERRRLLERADELNARAYHEIA